MEEGLPSGAEKRETPAEGQPREASGIEDEVRLVDYLYPLYKWRGLLILFLIATVGATALFTLRSPKIYEAKATLMPEAGGGEDVGLRASLAQQFGVAMPGQKADPSTLFTNVLKSRPFAERVAERLNLPELLGSVRDGQGAVSVVQLQQETAAHLLDLVDVKVDARRGSAITLTVPWRDPILAAHIANTYVAELDRYNREANVTKAKRLRLFLEDRLAQANRDLTLAQQDLRTFQEQHKAISIAEQAKQTLTTLTKLEAQKLDLEIQREAQERFVRESHTQAKALQAQLAALQKNIEQLKYADVMARAAERDGPLEYYVPLDQVPLLSFRESRLLLEVGTKSKVAELLTTQLEQTKLDEARELPTITVLEPAVVPDRPIKPKVRQNLLLGAVVGLFGGVMLAFVATYFERETQDTGNGSKWREMRQGLMRDLRRVIKLGKGSLWVCLAVALTACDGFPLWRSAPGPQQDAEVSASLLAAGYARGIYRSANGGKTWTPLALEGMEISHYFKVLALRAGPPPILYVGTTGQGLYQVSLDAERGPAALQRLKGINVKAILADPTDPDQLYAGTWGQGVMRSRDGGQSWEALNEGLTYPYVRALAMTPTTPATLYAGTVGGVFRRQAADAQWEPTSRGLGVLDVKALAVDTDPNIVYAGTSPAKKRGSLYRSTDGGESWTVSEEGPREVTVFAIVFDRGAERRVLVATSRGVMRSRDGGKQWEDWSAGLPAAPIYSLALTQGAPRAVFAATHGGVYRQLEGERSWHPLRYGLEGEMITALIPAHTDGLARAAAHRTASPPHPNLPPAAGEGK